ncbi:MAG: hypothetical protein WD431_22090, partial [Cyclobacteriaceae bacterium]
RLMIDWIKAVLVGVSVILFSFEKEDDIQYFQSLTIPIADSTDVMVVCIDDSLENQFYKVRIKVIGPGHWNELPCFRNWMIR